MEYEPTDPGGDAEMEDSMQAAETQKDADMGTEGHDYGDIDILQPIMNMCAEPIID